MKPQKKRNPLDCAELPPKEEDGKELPPIVVQGGRRRKSFCALQLGLGIPVAFTGGVAA
jgi:hypothetical protein